MLGVCTRSGFGPTRAEGSKPLNQTWVGGTLCSGFLCIAVLPVLFPHCRNKTGDNNYCTRKVLWETQGGKSVSLTGDSSRGWLLRWGFKVRVHHLCFRREGQWCGAAQNPSKPEGFCSLRCKIRQVSDPTAGFNSEWDKVIILKSFSQFSFLSGFNWVFCFHFLSSLSTSIILKKF